MAPSVKVRLEVDGTPEAIAAVRAFTAQTKAAGKEASSSFGGLSSALSGVTKLFAAYKVAQLVVQTAQFTAETVKLAAEQKDLALALGTTIKNYSAMAAVAKVTNTEQGKLNAGLGKLGDQIKDLREGAPAAVKAFRQLGLGAKDFATDDIVVNAIKIGEALERVARGGSKGAIATETLGKAGRSLLPVFEKLNELGGLEGATRFAERLGVLVDAKTAASFDQIALALQEIDLRARGIALAFGKAFGPQVLLAVEQLRPLFVDLKPPVEAFGKAIGYLARGFAELVVHTVAWGTVFGDVLTLQFAKARADFEKFDKMLKEMRAATPREPTLDDTVGPSSADLSAQEAARLAHLQRLEVLERQKYDATARVEEAIEAERYRKGEISLEAYYHNRERIITAALNRELLQIEAQLEDPKLEAGRRKVLQKEAAILDQQIAALVAGNAAALEAAREKASSFATELRDNVAKALTEFLTNGINQVRSLTDAFAQLGRVIAAAVQQAAGARLTAFITGALSPTKKAGGGLILGPGTGTSDSIPAWLSTGEYIVRAAAVRQPGVLPQLEALNRGWTGFETPQPLSRYHRYAEGGLVDLQQSPLVAGGAAGASVDGQVTIGLDDGLILRALESPAGQRVMLKVVGKNPRAFGTALRR